MQIQEIQTLVSRALQNAGASAMQADSTARALLAAEAQGLASHGVSRVPMYAGHLRAGRVIGNAVPKVAAQKPSAVLVEAPRPLRITTGNLEAMPNYAGESASLITTLPSAATRIAEILAEAQIALARLPGAQP